jgi:hypothetical protein
MVMMKTLIKFTAPLVALALFPGSLLQGYAGELKVQTADSKPPAEADESLIQAVQAKSVQVIEGDKVIYEFWFRSSIPLKAKPDQPEGLIDQIKETTFLGLVQVAAGQRDYKDNEIAPGPYTMRVAWQPEDGDHLGKAEYPFFAVLVPVAADTSVEGINRYRTLVKTSGKGTPTEHPVVLSLRPMASFEGDFPQLSEPAPDHKSLQVKTSAHASAPSEVAFEIVVKGKGKM